MPRDDLRIEVRRLHPDAPSTGEAKLLIEVEVANFYPAIAAGFSTPVYEVTQSAVHVLVTHGFLRSLATLDLAQSKVGALAPDPEDPEDLEDPEHIEQPERNGAAVSAPDLSRSARQ